MGYKPTAIFAFRPCETTVCNSNYGDLDYTTRCLADILKDGDVVLDIGCGPTAQSCYLIDRACKTKGISVHVIGVDPEIEETSSGLETVILERKDYREILAPNTPRQEPKSIAKQIVKDAIRAEIPKMAIWFCDHDVQHPEVDGILEDLKRGYELQEYDQKHIIATMKPASKGFDVNAYLQELERRGFFDD